MGLKKSLFLLLLVPVSFTLADETNIKPPIEIQAIVSSVSQEQTPGFVAKIAEKTVSFGAASVFYSFSLISRLAGSICFITPWTTTFGNECLLLSRLFAVLSKQAFAFVFKGPPSVIHPLPSSEVTLSQRSWDFNKRLLSQLPASTEEDKQLLHFLKERWLAKSNGFISFTVDWICPIFGIPMQIHPKSSHAYARDPWNNLSKTYNGIIKTLKNSLPQPKNFPLILTRPFDLEQYLPSCLVAASDEGISTIVARCANILSVKKVVLDLTHVLAKDANSQEEWLNNWNEYRAEFSQACKEQNIDANQILCIQRLKEKEIGGIRILPLAEHSSNEIELDHRFLLEWISCYGLTANRIELDRLPTSDLQQGSSFIALSCESKKEFLSYLDSFEKNLSFDHPEKTLMVQATLKALNGLLRDVSEEKWEEIAKQPTHSAVINLSFFNIKQQLQLLIEEEKDTLFFNTASHLEQIHANLTSLLEIFSPFTLQDFSLLYKNQLSSIPQTLKSLTSTTLHASAMTSVMGIFKAAEKMLGKAPNILYGENTYFECVKAAKLLYHPVAIQKATEEDWAQVDIILGHFNPVMQTDFHISEYKVEAIARTLHKALSSRSKPLILALDCTLDFINSPRVGRLLDEFQNEIDHGDLIIMGYRSGLKFDLFGMDNYCGAPFFMIHSKDVKWGTFDELLSNPALQTDRLSINWFSLAYKNTAKELECYRKKIFDNTRAILNEAPERLLSNKGPGYRIIPIEENADAAFIDIKISGPLHKVKGAALVAGSLLTTCMESGHPIFNRLSLGFYHPNFFMIFDEQSTTLRLTVGLDPDLIQHLVKCFNEIDALSDSPWKSFWSQLHELPLPLAPQEAKAF